MVDVTSRLEQYVAEGDLECCPTLDAEVDSLETVETKVAPETVEPDVALLSALADPTRYRLLRVLLESEERCVCELDALLDVSDSAISHALGRLVETGLVTRRKEGRWRIYAATDRAERIVGVIREETARWDDHGGAP